MPMQPHSRHTLPPPERPAGRRGAEALRAAARAGAVGRVELRLGRADGTEEAVSLPAAALPALADLLDGLAASEAVAVLAEDAELSPEEAAPILGVSRPLVRRRMDAGLLPFRRVGAHRRVRLADVLALRAREEERRLALAALAADAEDLERTHGL